MSPTTPTPSSLLADALEFFLDEAMAAHARGHQVEHDLWLKAASRVVPAEAALDTFVTDIRQHGSAIDAKRIAVGVARLYPDSAVAHFHAGLASQLRNDLEPAIAAYRRALTIDPDIYSLRNNLAAALLEIDSRSDEALELLNAACATHPGDANAWVNLGRARMARFDLRGALAARDHALKISPHDPVVLTNHAQFLLEQQDWDNAQAYRAEAFRLSPGTPSYAFNLSTIHLLRGNFAEGWPLHETRWAGSGELAGKRPVLPGPLWQGEPLAGKTLLLWGEQGMGDLLQFCRYVPMLADYVHKEGGRLAWNSFPQMGDLLGRTLARYVDDFSLGGGVEHLPAFDYEIPLLSLPLVFGTREETIPRNVPYLEPDTTACAAWRARLSGERRLKVGLTWTGSRTHKRNPFRRVGLERYVESFRDIQNVAFYSLQPDAGNEVAAARSAGFDIADYTAEWRTFDDTAAFVGALDLVITVCTSVAHLCGAIGQRTWVLLDANPHWVWMLDRTDSPWYPTATLYRQRQFMQWEPVLDKVKNDLIALAASRA
ncbi:tetratricopeptide repeat protein [Caballeronia sp. BR00000012568055]|uniref:tetratricopeptide repeat protein n=1 Tax=Caballeronia sp. BR00000012568055 TaxID=2918761 RepID=UPI0023F7DDEF|nr:tetratricopeptide repeat protein [Caballeronia sp. BR00000012568055]